MIDFVNYIFESGISLGLFTLLYLILLRKETYFRTNRYFLLAALFFSLVLPLIHLKILDPEPVLLGEITVTPFPNLLGVVSVYGSSVSESIAGSVSTSTYLLVIYLLGLLFFASRLLVRIIRILAIIRTNRLIEENGTKLVVIKSEISPFSFLSFVFVGEALKQQAGWQKMLMHELEHVKQGHSYDILILEIISVFQWFNPFIRLLKRVVRENHEYLADQAVLAGETNVAEYKQILLQQFIGRQFQVANHFNYSLIKNRLKMMSKIRSSKLAAVKLTGGLLVALVLVAFFACEKAETGQVEEVKEAAAKGRIVMTDGLKTITMYAQEDSLNEFIEFFKTSADYEILSIENGELRVSRKGSPVVEINQEKKEEPVQQTIDGKPVFFVVDEMPEYPGGEEALRKYIAGAVKYPVVAQDKGIQGRVFVSFVVDKNGQVRNARVVRGVDPSLDQEALRVVSGMPSWKAGKQRGEEVAVSYTVPIKFSLE
ncbi:TonB family protein [Gaoshiqia sp. Z1-71]|uniref:TonB family protein n=1 Tax=Gaoshiqia hydrogeniformans TaxID=3290090 RepID=UPI003BF8C064